MTTVISPNIKRTSERINPNGDVINPKTKQVIAPNTQEYIPTPEEAAIVAPQVTESTTIKVNSVRTLKVIKDEIVSLEAKLAELQEEKKLKVEEMKKELEEAEN